MELNLTKEQSLNALDLRKDKIQTLCLQKPTLQTTKSRVALCLDFSGSMRDEYNDGTVQSIVERMLPLAMQFDDNGEMELWIFENGFKRLDTINLSNYYGYIKDNVIGKYNMGGTNYSPVIRDVAKLYIEEEPQTIPNYVIFITDGDNSDKPLTTETIRALSHYPIFFEFIGIGREGFSFLEKLDDLEGRFVDNADYFSIRNINAMSDDDLYAKMLTEYPKWLEMPEVKSMIASAGTYQKIDYTKKTDKPKKGLFGFFK